MEAAPSLGEAYQRYGPALVRKAERVLRDRDAATDTVHSLFVELAEHPPRGRELELPYLYRAVTNRCLNHLRDHANRARLLEREQPLLGGPSRLGPGDRVLGLDLMTRLRDALDDDHMALLIYRFVDDMTQDEIAELTHVSRKTIGKRLARVQAAIDALAAEVAHG